MCYNAKLHYILMILKTATNYDHALLWKWECVHFFLKFCWLQLNILIACNNVHLSPHKPPFILPYKTHKEYFFENFHSLFPLVCVAF